MSESPMKPGKDTTEYQEAKSSQIMTYVGMIMAAILAYAPKVIEGLEADSKYAIIGAAVIAVVSAVNGALVKLGYISSRTQVKVAAEKVALEEAKAKQ